MAQATISHILKKVKASRGSVWSPKDFADLGTRAAVDQALHRLAKAGILRKVARGLYDYPQSSPIVGKRSPRVDAVAKAAARARGARVRPTGAVAANALGLSTQVPARAEYITDGPARTIDVGGRQVKLRRVSPKRLALPGGAGALVEALRYLGKDAVRALSDAQIGRVVAALTEADVRALRNALHHTPDWMRPMIDTVVASHATGNEALPDA
jgi:Family of unknown function (DUF6088)